MARWQPQKNDVLDALAAEILHNYSRGRAIVAIDGYADAGGAAFAGDLADAIRRTGHAAERASIDAFRTVEAGGTVGGYDPAAFDYAGFRDTVIDRFRRRPGTEDVAEGAVPADAVLVVDGVLLNRPELRGIWNWSIWLEQTLPGAAGARAAEDGIERSYVADAGPRVRAVAIVDNTDPDHPRRVFADSC